MTTSTTAAGIYARISADPEGREYGIGRQVEDCRALAERLGCEVVEVFKENDVSASTNSRKPRPEYARMLDRAKAGELGAIIAYSNSRLTRRPREVEDLIDLHNRYGIRLHTVVSGEDDLATADGRMTARIKASVDAAEAERTSERARRAKHQAAQEGRHRGGPRPFGWEADGVTLRPAETDAIQNAATEVLAGRSLASVARGLNQAGLTTTTGRPWTHASLRSMLCRARNAALVSRGKADRPGMEIIGPAKWPAILSEDVWRAVLNLLTDTSRRSQFSTETKWLGSGLYLCGACDTPTRGTMRVSPYRAADGTQRRLYRCTRSAHLTISQESTDEIVMWAVGGRISEPAIVSAILAQECTEQPTEVLREERERLQARLAVFDQDYTAGDIPASMWMKATAKVRQDLDAVDEALARAVGEGALANVLASVDPQERFVTAPLDVQRTVVSGLGLVTIMPTGRGHSDASRRNRVQIAWRHDA